MLRLALPMALTSPPQHKRSSPEYASEISNVRIQPWATLQWVYCRLSFVVMRSVAEQFVRVSHWTVVADCISRHDVIPFLLVL